MQKISEKLFMIPQLKKLALFVFIICSSEFIYAQQESNKVEPELSIQDLYNLPLEELLSMKVSTGSFLNLDLRNSSMSLTIISSDQIESSGARHLSEVLEIFVPGFQYMVNKWNGIIWGMRGVASDRNTKFIFLVNGHKMNTESRDGAMTELDLGLLDDIKRIEVLRGPAGLMYGSGAIAGVVNIVTKDYKNEEITASVKMQTWSMNTFGQEAQIGGSHKFNENTSIRVDFGTRKSDGVGRENSRIWGRPSWPYDQTIVNPSQKGVPTNGSAQSTPGDSKFAIKLKSGNLQVYSRWTHQVTNGSGWFIVDPWPDVDENPTAANSDRMVDGYMRSWNSIYAASETYGYNRRQYVFNNISTTADYILPVGENQITFNAGVDAVTNRIQLEDMKGYEKQYATERNTQIVETFGERRYNLCGTYVLSSKVNYQLAAGGECRIYDIGDDMSGKNSQSEKATHPIVTDVTYFYNSVFSEGVYHFSKKFDGHWGLRYDLHTRTIQYGGVLNPKVGAVYKINENHYLKLFYQQSANNGSADNYEFNRNSIGDDGKTFEGSNYHFSELTDIYQLIPPVTESDLHKLKPERAQSFEFMSFHRLSNDLVLLPSVSYNTVSNLFAWNQTLFRVVNAGKYNFINIDIDMQYTNSRISAGINHTLQKLVGMNVKDQEIVMKAPVFQGKDSSLVGETWVYSPKRVKAVDGTDSSISVVYNFIRDGISVDGENFMNLATNVTKIYADYKCSSWMTIHASARIFWGLVGRKDLYDFDSTTNTNEALEYYTNALANAKNYPYLGIQHQPMVKMNIGTVLGRVDSKLKVSFHIYDLFGGNGSHGSINSLRWMQAFDANSTDLYGMDYRSYAVKLQYTF